MIVVGEKALDCFGSKTQDRGHIAEAGFQELVNLPFDERSTFDLESALGNLLRQRKQATALASAQDDGFHVQPWPGATWGGAPPS